MKISISFYILDISFSSQKKNVKLLSNFTHPFKLFPLGLNQNFIPPPHTLIGGEGVPMQQFHINVFLNFLQQATQPTTHQQKQQQQLQQLLVVMQQLLQLPLLLLLFLSLLFYYKCCYCCWCCFDQKFCCLFLLLLLLLFRMIE
jgi:hypothetical protein